MTIVFDTETTGIDSNAEILEIAIVDGDGNSLLHTRVRPKRTTVWKEAEAVHHISYNDVKNLPTIDTYAQAIKTIFEQADLIVGYNVAYDVKMLQQSGINIKPTAKVRDVMKMYGEIRGEWNHKYNNYKWWKLVECAEYYNYEWTGAAHGAMADTLATLFCYYKVLKDIEAKSTTAIVTDRMTTISKMFDINFNTPFKLINDNNECCHEVFCFKEQGIFNITSNIYASPQILGMLILHKLQIQLI